MSRATARIRQGAGIRRLAACLFQASLLAYVELGWIAVEGPGPAILAAAALLNLLAYATAIAGWERLGRLAHFASPVWGVAAWASLTYLSGGVASSLFVAGFWFEILVSVLSHSVPGILVIAALSLGGLWAQQNALGLEGAMGPLSLQTSLLAIAGASAAWVRHTWGGRQERLASSLDEQKRRLLATEEELEDARTLARLGERNARIGHGLKNAVHSLRGFTALIERKADRAALDSGAFRGLSQAIDQLDSLAHETLRPGSSENGVGHTGCEELRELVRATFAELTAVYPGLDCRLVGEVDGAPVGAPRRILAEVLSNLAKNGAESMEGRGELTVRVHRADGTVCIDVCDRGPGVAPELAERVFRPGLSTKARGHGMGLYISRRLVEAHGGTLSLTPEGAGASFRIVLPESSRA